MVFLLIWILLECNSPFSSFNNNIWWSSLTIFSIDITFIFYLFKVLVGMFYDFHLLIQIHHIFAGYFGSSYSCSCCLIPLCYWLLLLLCPVDFLSNKLLCFLRSPVYLTQPNHHTSFLNFPRTLSATITLALIYELNHVREIFFF